MRLIQKTVHYCCVRRGNQVLYSYSGGNREIEDLADLCIDKTPPFHSWYFETYHGRTFGFLIEEGCVYFAIFDDSFTKQGVLQFLSNLKDEFKRVARKVSKGNLSRINATALQERLAPAIRRLITSLEQTSLDWPIEIRALDHGNLSPSPINMTGQQVESTSSTKAPLLGRNNNPDKKKNKDHVVAMRDIEMEPCKSTDKGVRTESSSQDSSVQKDSGLVKNRSLSRSPSARKKWWRQVRIVLAIDVAVCAVLFIIWLTICLHTDCMR